jgi:hypothetical protein
VSKRGQKQAHADRVEPHGRILDLTEAGLWIALLVIGSLVALAVLRDGETRNRTRADAKPAPGGLIEAEDLPVIAKSREFSFWRQPSTGFSAGFWSDDSHMFAHKTEDGDWIELGLPEQEPGRYAIELFMTKAADYGIIAVSINGVRREAFDLWSGRGVVPTGAHKLDDVELSGSDDVIRFAIEGKNPNAISPFFQFGIDGIRIEEPASLPDGDGETGVTEQASEAGPIQSESDADRASAEAE